MIRNLFFVTCLLAFVSACTTSGTSAKLSASLPVDGLITFGN